MASTLVDRFAAVDSNLYGLQSRLSQSLYALKEFAANLLGLHGSATEPSFGFCQISFAEGLNHFSRENIQQKSNVKKLFSGVVRCSEVSEGPERVSPVPQRAQEASGELPEVQNRLPSQEIRICSRSSGKVSETSLTPHLVAFLSLSISHKGCSMDALFPLLACRILYFQNSYFKLSHAVQVPML